MSKLSVYKGSRTLITDFQLCKSYFGVNESLRRIAERILIQRFNEPWQQKLIRKAIFNLSDGKHISIPKLKIDSSISSILENFVDERFNQMVGDLKNGNSYPVFFRDIVNSKR